MQPIPSRRDRTLKLALAGLLLLVLLVVVSFATRSGFGRASPSQPTPGYVSWAMSVFLVFFVLMIPVAIYAYGIQSREFRAQRERRPYHVRVIRNLAFVLLLAVIGVARIYWHGKFHVSWTSPAIRHPPGSGKLAGGHQSTYEPTFKWPVLYATILLAVLVAGWFWWAARRNPAPALEPLDAEPTVAEDVAASIADAIDDLEAEPDARVAVIAAYARMERTFGRHGLDRRSSETPVEYLRRILVGLGSRTEPVARLTGLFEQAKFSDHEIDSSMKHDAIEALRAIRSDLQAVPA